MPINRSEQFHKRKSDALRQITGAIEKAKEAPEPEIVEALKDASAPSTPIIKAPPAKPQIKQEPPKEENKERRDKRVTLYLTQDEYDMFREQAYRRHKKLNEVIVTAAKKNIGRPPAPPKKFIEETEENQ
ncbi:hypothetical protein SELR_pSRC300020 (plasmid) [Selenomonas ruminantium subsp. lactilytica TAM6421]|uniref:Uncharacterized protein n=1 Tax=Selenomonas ruminantium subsp. lactilytica (strain NBRC 103574 / TAM6421) TaxID=927704 RepID=I0GWD8_SELRL|nr:hypothetical protein [Selenomonas ruminantium]BAL85075.1 hypothetical protein SELR_pSRC300020 [Selenomonas ruminantium subsp. lactilytica TAM6421]